MECDGIMEYKPYLISWNVTRRCNLNCTHCYIDANMRAVASKNELTTSEGFRLLDEIAELCPGVMLILTGGEPLLRPDIFDLARYGVEKNLIIVLGTNGYLVTETVVKKLVEIGVYGLGISLDSMNPESHDRFRGKEGSWQRALEAMEACRTWKLDFQVQTSVTSDNVSEISALLELSREKGARAFNLFFLVCTGRGQKITDISPAQYEDVLSFVVKLGGHYKGMIVRARCAPYISRITCQKEERLPIFQEYVGCIAGTKYCRITPEGEVTPCPYLPVVAGHLREGTFGEIWCQSEVLNQLRRGDLKGKCGMCDYKTVCGGCRARAFATTSDYLAEDSWCPYEPVAPGYKSPPSQSGTPGSFDDSSEKMAWSEEAIMRFEKAPLFVREMVMDKIEKYAAQRGYERITLEVLEEVKKNWKMKMKFK